MSVSRARAEQVGRALPLVLLPGTLCDTRVFAALLDQPALRARRPSVIAIPGAADMDEAAAAIEEALPHRCALLGFSLGGIVALHVARHAPDRIAALALVASTALAVPPAEREARRLHSEPDAATLDAIVARENDMRYFGHAGTEADPYRTLVADMARRLGGGVLRRQTELALDRPDMRSLLPHLAMPVLVLGGGEDAINPPALQRQMARLLPDATLAIIPGAGHFVTLEAPRTAAEAIDSWLARVENPVSMEETA